MAFEVASEVPLPPRCGLRMGQLGRTRATFEGTDDPLEMEALFRAFKKIGFGEGLLPGATTPGLGRIIGEGVRPC